MTRDDVAGLALPGALVRVFVDGRHDAALSRGEAPRGVTLGSVREHRALLDVDVGDLAGFAALNAACASDGAYVHIESGIVVDAPIQLLFIATQDDVATHCRNVVLAGEASRACIVEQHVALGAARYLTNTVTRLDIAVGADMQHHKLQHEHAGAFHVAALDAALAGDAQFASGSYALGAALSRSDIRVVLDAQGAQCTLDGLTLADARRHADHHTRIDHAQPHGTSRELYKSVLADASRAVFNGRVVVHPNAVRTDAAQQSRNLLLSREAQADAQPQLEIYADDVRCSHGATVGALDAEQIHYLRSRGIAESAARAWLTYAFAAEIVERVRVQALRARLDALVRARLPGIPEALE